MRRADACPQAFGRGSGSVGIALGAAVPLVEDRQPLARYELRVRPDEARVSSQVHEGRGGPQDTCYLGEHGGEVVHVCVDPRRHGGVEACVRERYGRCVRVHGLDSPPAGES